MDNLHEKFVSTKTKKITNELSLIGQDANNSIAMPNIDTILIIIKLFTIGLISFSMMGLLIVFMAVDCLYCFYQIIIVAIMVTTVSVFTLVIYYLGQYYLQFRQIILNGIFMFNYRHTSTYLNGLFELFQCCYWANMDFEFPMDTLVQSCCGFNSTGDIQCTKRKLLDVMAHSCKTSPVVLGIAYITLTCFVLLILLQTFIAILSFKTF